LGSSGLNVLGPKNEKKGDENIKNNSVPFFLPTGSVPYANRAGRATAEEIHRVVSVVMQARFANVMTTDEWVNALNTGVTPERDSIFSSNQRARRE
jgi:hypothetical protein